MTTETTALVDGPWWVAYATDPDKLFQMAEETLQRATTHQERALKISERLADGENNRHAYKLAAIERLMQMPSPSGKGNHSYTAAADLVGADDNYRDYLAHLGTLQRELDAERHAVTVQFAKHRLILEAIRRTNREG